MHKVKQEVEYEVVRGMTDLRLIVKKQSLVIYQGKHKAIDCKSRDETTSFSASKQNMIQYITLRILENFYLQSNKIFRKSPDNIPCNDLL